MHPLYQNPGRFLLPDGAPEDVPADAFYEWRVVEGSKRPVRTGSRWTFDGLWESFRWPAETVTRSFTILTTS